MEQARSSSGSAMDNTVDTMKEDDSLEKAPSSKNVKVLEPLDESSRFGGSDNGQDLHNENEFERTAIRCFRYFIILLMLSATIAAGVASFNYLHGEEGRDFEKEFEVVADDIRLLSSDRLEAFRADFRSLAWTITGLAKSSNTSWPYYTDVNFPVIVSNFRKTTKTSMIALSPIIRTVVEEAQWANYSQTHQGWLQEHWAYQQGQTSIGHVSSDIIYPGIFRWTDQGRIREDSLGPFLPLWQIMDAPRDPSNINLNLLSDTDYKEVFDHVLREDEPIMTEIYDNLDNALLEKLEPNRNADLPTSLFLYPVYEDVTLANAVAILTASINWLPVFALASDEATPPVDVVVSEGCNRLLTIQVTGPNVQFRGYQDLHDPAYDQYVTKFPLAPSIEFHHLTKETGVMEDDLCPHGVYVYPTKGFWEQYHTTAPASTTGIIVGAFFFMCIIFYLYDAAVHMRQKRILKVASQSEKILSVLYPKTIRDRLFGLEEKPEDHDAMPSAKGGKKGGRKRGLNDDLIKATKFQLKQFMKSSPGYHDAMTGGGGAFDSKPIADLFLDATVLFADISGFTAWSSVREPTQVFTLLESVYRALDIIARKRKVFKVETVGDCYVAVTGLPEPTKDHARIMAVFAQEAVLRFEELVGMLETTLGPDTGDLGIRVGMHSGPVTAGVLRGDKSRFQLFGDTVNTASRVESTGKRNMIHVSQETAHLLTAAGMQDQLSQRQELVSAKGKGKLQTYWLKIDRPEEEQAEYSSMQHNTPSHDGLQSGSYTNGGGFVTQPTNYNNTCLNTDASNYEAIEEMLAPRVRRLCQWNVDILARHLKQIVAHRNAQAPSEHNYNEELSRREVAICRQMDVLDEVVEIIPLPGFDPQVYKRKQQSADEIELPEVVMKQIRLYVACIAAMYHDNPFHNFEHASHVMMSVSKLLSRIVAADDILNEDENAAEANDFGWSIHDHTYGITSDPMTQFSVILAAMVHDVDHTGVSNAQLVKENHRLAAMFDDKSVAEQNSMVLAWDILMDSRFHDFRRTIYTAPFELDRFRQLMGNTVMATDIMDKELQALRRNRWDMAFNVANPSEQGVEVNPHAAMAEGTKDKVNRKATIVIEHLIQASDVAHTMQHWHIYQKWNERLFAEMTLAYKAGRLGFNPAEKWYQGEIGFYDHYIIPLAKKLKDCGVFGVASDEYLNYAMENRQEWEEKGHAFVAELTAKYMGDVQQEEEKFEPAPQRPSAIEAAPANTDETGSITSQVSGMSGSLGSDVGEIV